MDDRGTSRLFRWIVTHPRRVIAASLLCVLACGVFLPRIEKDVRSKAYTRADHPARLAMDRLETEFGLGESVIVAVVAAEGDHVFRPETLQLVDWLSEKIADVDGVDPERVTSLASENDMRGSADGMRVEPFFEDPPQDAAGAAAVRKAVLDFPLYVNTLVSADGRATLVVAELLDESYGASVYEAIRSLTAHAPVARGERLHVAGLGAYNALIGDYIDADLRRLNPFAMAVVLGLLALAYRSGRGVGVPAGVVTGSVVVAFGAMAAAGVPIYGITGSMSVILIAIGVSDGIHILGHYYAEQAAAPDDPAPEIVARAMSDLGRPIWVTSLTSMIGFLALGVATDLPPLRWYGVFASLGVAAALALSLFTVPAVLSLLSPRPSPALGRAGLDLFARSTAALGRGVGARPGGVLVASALLLAGAGVFAAHMERNNELRSFLDESEPLYAAETAINETLGGIITLDVIVEAEAPGGLMEPAALRRIDALERDLAKLPHAVGTRSVVDYVKQMHRAMHADDPAFYTLPDDADLVAQYFLLYSTSGDPSDFEDVIDYDYRLANVRTTFDRGRWSDARRIVPAARELVTRHLGENGLRGELSGWMNVAYHNDDAIGRGQRLGTVLAFFAVWATTVFCFRSFAAGSLAMLPTGVAVLAVYAAMGALDIWLNFATAMTATIAIGLSVDFGVHAIDRLIGLVQDEGRSLDAAYAELFPSTGRALFFNFACIFFGFGVLVSSHVPSVREFGLLSAVCVAASFLSSLTLVPALAKLLRPGFLAPGVTASRGTGASAPRHTAGSGAAARPRGDVRGSLGLE